ncbi:PREDICTED: chymotrypsin-2-like [Ceratosolen solmsi marchali]|uniref:Chymotrypsin-2-like n=1 Tax=Ceratosolen solmsi marchali TaxID=326594 RepID=A0AAJ6VNN7_9HYME|nr:PREDICTED: chymotrypsin-2-like [Ceratosolen solmsi marchali]
MNFQIFYFTAQLILFCNLNHVAQALFGENVRLVRSSEYPFVTSLLRISTINNQLTETHFCSGALISMKDVLTAEHCLAHELLASLLAMVGLNDFRYGKKYGVAWWVTYDQWTASQRISKTFNHNDIAILRLAHEVHDVTPATISRTITYGLYDLEVVALGWGKFSNGEINPKMNAANLKIITNFACENKVESMLGIKDTVSLRFVCSIAEPEVLLQRSDAGGPLVYNDEIIGINLSACPDPEKQPCTSAVNIHLVIEYYNYFISSVKNA